jgi:hypothetical protein
MKKKNPRDIPDFSRQVSRRAADGTTPRITKPGAPTPPAAPRSTVKPHSTSSKSGRRGQ